jgi:hypothetical protein
MLRGTKFRRRSLCLPVLFAASTGGTTNWKGTLFLGKPLGYTAESQCIRSTVTLSVTESEDG